MLGRLCSRKTTRRSQAGDTIIEVLIAITVVSSVLAGAYVTTNHSLRDNRDAQERSTAVKLAESQLELLRNMAMTNPGVIPPAPVVSGSGFCIIVDPTTHAITVPTVTNTPANPCAVDSTGVHTTAEPVYNLETTSVATAVNSASYTTFTITVKWNSVLGGTDSALIQYRVDV